MDNIIQLGAQRRWEAEASLNAAKRSAFASLSAFKRLYADKGCDAAESRRRAATHLPVSLLRLLGIDR